MIGTRRPLDRSISHGDTALLDRQRPDGEWCFELEADSTIPAGYVLFRHYLGEPVDSGLEPRSPSICGGRKARSMAAGRCSTKATLISSTSLKAYFALKTIGDPVEAPHMTRAREAMRSRGGAARCNVFTRIMLGLFRDHSMARGADDARRGHAVSEMVSIPSR